MRCIHGRKYGGLSPDRAAISLQWLTKTVALIARWARPADAAIACATRDDGFRALRPHLPGDRSRHVSAALIARGASAEYDNGRTRDGCGRVECLLRCDAMPTARRRTGAWP
ncbi:hypothetical protein XAR_2890 [Xanthomonas citri pv. glycines str. 8ra]|nr:hypothetical protein XAR_2890 [Xanthomonas citri pv. glycines str. 8ra]